MIFYPFSIVSIAHNLRLCGASAPIFCVNFLYVSFFTLNVEVKVVRIYMKFVKQRMKGDGKVHLSSKDFASFSEISSIVQLLHNCPMWETELDGNSETND